MREARIIMPLVSTDSQHTREHDRLKRALAQNFGGYTVTIGSGGWVDGRGFLIRETVAIYDIAMPDTKLNRSRVRDLAYLTAVELKQESVYVRTPDGNVHIDAVAHTKRDPVLQAQQALSIS